MEASQKLINVLINGHRHEVTLQKDGKEQKLFIEADPQFRSVNIYDKHSKKITLATALGHKTVGPVQQTAKRVNFNQGMERVKKNGLSIT